METVLLAITEKGLATARHLASNTGASVWCDARALSEVQFANLVRGTLTRFAHALDSRDAVDDAVNTIVEHHPGCVVFVERSAALG
jgi:hypothetical protein